MIRGIIYLFIGISSFLLRMDCKRMRRSYSAYIDEKISRSSVVGDDVMYVYGLFILLEILCIIVSLVFTVEFIWIVKGLIESLI